VSMHQRRQVLPGRLDFGPLMSTLGAKAELARVLRSMRCLFRAVLSDWTLMESLSA
jgi:hypothetical protein